jgi:hypothetical protein
MQVSRFLICWHPVRAACIFPGLHPDHHHPIWCTAMLQIGALKLIFGKLILVT